MLPSLGKLSLDHQVDHIGVKNKRAYVDMGETDEPLKGSAEESVLIDAKNTNIYVSVQRRQDFHGSGPDTSRTNWSNLGIIQQFAWGFPEWSAGSAPTKSEYQHERDKETPTVTKVVCDMLVTTRNEPPPDKNLQQKYKNLPKPPWGSNQRLNYWWDKDPDSQGNGFLTLTKQRLFRLGSYSASVQWYSNEHPLSKSRVHWDFRRWDVQGYQFTPTAKEGYSDPGWAARSEEHNRLNAIPVWDMHLVDIMLGEDVTLDKRITHRKKTLPWAKQLSNQTVKDRAPAQVAPPEVAPQVVESSLFLDIPASDPDYDQEMLFYIRASVESIAALQALTLNTVEGRAALLQAVNPRESKIWTPPYNSPEVVVQTSNDYYDEDHDSSTPWNQRPLYIVVRGQDGYDGPGPRMASFSAPNRSVNNITSTIEQLMSWFREDDGHGWFQDELGLYGPVDGWVGRHVDKRAISIDSQLYVYLTLEQKQELLRFGYEEVHVQVTYDSFNSMDIYVNPSDHNDDDENRLWQTRLQRRNLPATADVKFLYKNAAYAVRLLRLVQQAFLRHS